LRDQFEHRAASLIITVRYVQILFEEEGMTFTEFVLDERLFQARKNRKFRACFGASPSEIREAQRRNAQWLPLD